MIITEKQLILLFGIADSVYRYIKTGELSIPINEESLQKLLSTIYNQQSNELMEVK